jgi:hypothetical protein
MMGGCRPTETGGDLNNRKFLRILMMERSLHYATFVPFAM